MNGKKVLIMGAAGRDFHNFNVFYRDNPSFEVMAFTAEQIPGIADRIYPAKLAGKLYPKGIQIYPEAELAKLIKEKGIEEVVLAYSDLQHEEVMHKASSALAAGADFIMLGPNSTMLGSKKQVIAICAVRTGCGKSQTTRAIAEQVKKSGLKPVVVRHPMPYGDLEKQAVERFAELSDLDRHECTIEEREEYEAHILKGTIVYAGVDYGRILEQAEKEADIILWDGGNNDFPFYRPDLLITVTDPHRLGHETTYHPGETNAKMADILLVNKIETAEPGQAKTLEKNLKKINPKARIIEGKSPVTADKPELIKGKIVLVVEDGPTLTHGGMRYGAGSIAAKKYGAKEAINPKAYAVGSIKGALEKYPQSINVLPAMGYSKAQMKELEETIKRVPCDTVVVATPINLAGLINIEKPHVRVTYELDSPGLEKEIDKFIKSKKEIALPQKS